MKTRVIFFGLLCMLTAIANCCFGQFKLKGRITDTSGHPLSETTILLTTAKSSAIASTDAGGVFVFNNLKKDRYLIAVYSINRAAKKVSVFLADDTVVHITLNPLHQSLQELTVTGKKPVIERKGDRIIFNVANSISAAGSNGMEVLEKAPGVKVSGSDIALAGKGTLGVMVNGRLLHLSDKALIGYLRTFPSANIDKIEVITHPSAKYDAEGLAGLINIVTKRSDDTGWSGSLTGSIKRFFYKNQPNYKGIQNYGDIDGSTGLYYNNKKWSFYTQASYTVGRELWGYGIDVFYDDMHWAMKDTGEYRIATLNVLAGTDYKLSRNTTVGFSYNYSFHLEDGADYVRTPIYNNKGERDSLIKTFATYYPVSKGNAFNVHLIQKVNESGAKLNLNADYFNYYRTDKSYLKTRSYLNNGMISDAGISELYDTTLQNIRIYTFKADLHIPTPFAKWSFGGKMSFINNYSNIYYYHLKDKNKTLDEELSNEFRYVENTQALYADVAKQIDKWQLSAGLRAEITQTKAISYFDDLKVKERYLKLFPSLSIAFTPSENNHWSLTFNERIHRPTFWNMNPYLTFMSAYTYVEGNPYLEPEYITNIELMHRYKNKLTSSLFARIIDNGFARVIQTHDKGDYLHTTTMLNFIKSYRYGLSESIAFHPFKWFESRNLLSGYYTQVRSGVPFIKGIDGLGAYVETNNTFYLNSDKTLNIFLGFWYQFSAIEHFGRSDDHYSLDAGLEWMLLQKKLHLALNFNDIFQSSAFGVATTVDGVKNRYTNFQLNSQLRLSAAWYFGKQKNKNTSTETSNKSERSRL